jgi:hypothetical protein
VKRIQDNGNNEGNVCRTLKEEEQDKGSEGSAALPIKKA